jgi:hypothetical protein
MNELLKMNSKIYGEYYTKEIKGYFDEGSLVTVYTNYSLRTFTIDKNENVFTIQHLDFGTIFFTKEEFRNKKINKILK